VEDSVLSHYKGFTTFRDLGQGSFLQLLSEHKELETLISISAHAEESALGVRKSDVIDLLQQCGVDSEKVMLKWNIVDLSNISASFYSLFSLCILLSSLPQFIPFPHFVSSFVFLTV
jgi:hypothetical protein